MSREVRSEMMYRSLVEEGAALFEKREYALAITRFWGAFRIRPAAPIVLFNIGRTMAELNDPRCEDFYAAAASQGNMDAYYELARLCSASGRRDEAVEHLSAYLKGNPANDSCTEWARNAIQQLCPRPLLLWSKGQSRRSSQ